MIKLRRKEQNSDTPPCLGLSGQAVSSVVVLLQGGRAMNTKSLPQFCRVSPLISFCCAHNIKIRKVVKNEK
jgi:hypothetical protein